MAVLSAPRAGGELRREPTTENRNRAHEAPVELGVVRVITSPHKTGEGTVTSSIHRLKKVGDAIFCGPRAIIARPRFAGPRGS
jgi:hypothetical protein